MKGKRSWFPNEEGQLSIDFIIGFTIFMIAFIFVISMVSGLLVGLQSRTIDYDAVAYRTSVMLVEDPGEIRNWHLLDRTYMEESDYIKRLGLSISRLSPGLLQQQKVDAFFDNSSSPGFSGANSLVYPDDYVNRLIFGDYPYSFNITLRKLDDSTPLSVGPYPPPKYGYIRRMVKIKQAPTMTLDLLEPSEPEAVSSNLIINMDFYNLYNRTNPLYRIDPLNEPIIIDVQNVINPTKITSAPLYDKIDIIGPASNITVPEFYPTIWIIKGTGETCASWPCEITSGHFYVYIDEGFFRPTNIPLNGTYDEFSTVNVKLYLDQYSTDGYPYNFNYSTVSIAPPEPAVLEVKVW